MTTTILILGSILLTILYLVAPIYFIVTSLKRHRIMQSFEEIENANSIDPLSPERLSHLIKALNRTSEELKNLRIPESTKGQLVKR